MIVDYTRQILHRHLGDGQSFVSAVIDIEALRYWRTHVSLGSWVKDLRTEQFELIYKQPIIPKNLLRDKTPGTREERLQLERNTVKELIRRGIYTRPGRWADEE